MEPDMIGNLTPKEEEVIQVLGEIGLKKNEARVLVIFMRGGELTSREIERYTDLRQPEVSIAVTALTKRNWICTSNLITENKGRPVKLFTLAQPVEKILFEIKSDILGDFSKQIAYIDKVSNLMQGTHEYDRQDPIIEIESEE
jgi:predicted transcriptional regulator